MDPLSQGVIGAVAAQQASNKKHLIIATLLGFFTGMSADLDIFFRSINLSFFLSNHFLGEDDDDDDARRRRKRQSPLDPHP